MLTNVPSTINRTVRNVVINHPNTYNCQVYRKTVTRQPAGAPGELPALGGLGVLDSMDEEQYEYAFLGRGYAMQADSFAAAPMMKKGDANIGAEDVFRFLVEPEHPSGAEWFDLRTHDVLYLVLGDGPEPAMLAFEIVGEETTSNIPPFTTRYVTNRRDDLHIPAGG